MLRIPKIKSYLELSSNLNKTGLTLNLLKISSISRYIINRN